MGKVYIALYFRDVIMGDIVVRGGSGLVAKLSAFELGERELNFACYALEDMKMICSNLYDHSVDVMERSVGYARILGMDEDEMCFVSLMHDVGKLGVGQYLLDKEGVFSHSEFEEMKIHTEVGYEMLKAEGFDEAARVALEHHMHQPNRYPDFDIGEFSSYSGVVALADFVSARSRNDGRYVGTGRSDFELLKECRPGMLREIGVLDAVGVFA